MGLAGLPPAPSKKMPSVLFLALDLVGCDPVCQYGAKAALSRLLILITNERIEVSPLALSLANCRKFFPRTAERTFRANAEPCHHVHLA